PDCRIRLKEISDQLENFRKGLTQIAAGGQRPRETIQSRCAFFPAALGLFAFVQLGCQMSDDYGDDEVRAEHHAVLELADVKPKAWRNKQKVPQERAESREEKRRPTAQTHSSQYNCK